MLAHSFVTKAALGKYAIIKAAMFDYAIFKKYLQLPALTLIQTHGALVIFLKNQQVPYASLETDGPPSSNMSKCVAINLYIGIDTSGSYGYWFLYLTDEPGPMCPCH